MQRLSNRGYEVRTSSGGGQIHQAAMSFSQVEEQTSSYILPSRTIWNGSEVTSRSVLQRIYILGMGFNSHRKASTTSSPIPSLSGPTSLAGFRFAYDRSGSYLGNTAYAMPADRMWLLPIMNSELVEFVLCHAANTLRGGYLRLIYEYVTRVPIVTPEGNVQAELEALTNEILYVDTEIRAREIEREIGTIIFRLYGLSASEHKLVLDWLGERRETLGIEMPHGLAETQRLASLCWSVEGRHRRRAAKAGHSRQPGSPHSACAEVLAII